MYRRSDQFRPTRPSEQKERPAADPASARNLGAGLREAITGFSLFDDADDKTAAKLAQARLQQQQQQARRTYRDPFADARHAMKVAVCVAMGMSSMTIVYVFAKILTANLMKFAPLH